MDCTANTVRTLQALVGEASDCRVITLSAREYDLSAGELEISRSVTLLGNGAVLDAKAVPGDNRRVLSVLEGIEVEMHGLHITGGYNSYDGGGILTSGTLTMTQCNITDNTAIGHNGGGIFVASGRLILNECSLENNHAHYYSGGGGIYVHSGNLALSHCSFENNYATVGEGSNAKSDGGAIFVQSGTVYLRSVSFIGNSALLRGGAIFIQATARLHATNITVANNTATASVTAFGAAGGGIYNLGTVLLFGGRVYGNHAPQANDSANIFNGADLTYILPAPPGFHVEGVFVCGESNCFEPWSQLLLYTGLCRPLPATIL
jgi:predicted outer membrane repeat protein